MRRTPIASALALVAALSLTACNDPTAAGESGASTAAPKRTAVAATTPPPAPVNNGAVCDLVKKEDVGRLIGRLVLSSDDQDIVGPLEHNPDFCEYILGEDQSNVTIYRIPGNTMDVPWEQQHESADAKPIAGLGGLDAIEITDTVHGNAYMIRQRVGMVIFVQGVDAGVPEEKVQDVARFAVSHL